MKPLNNNSKKGYIMLLIGILIAAAIIVSIPDIVIKSIPTVQNVSVKKLTHNEALDVSGNIIKNASTGTMWIQTFVNERDICEVNLGQLAEITGDAFPDCVYSGEVTNIADTASKIQVGNSIKTMVQVDIEITDADDLLKPGYTANANIKISEPKEMAILPYDVINQDDIGEFVYLLREGKAVKRYISTGAELSEGVEVLNGISDEDVVISGENDISEGKSVIIDD